MLRTVALYHRHHVALLARETLRGRIYVLENLTAFANYPRLGKVQTKHITGWLAGMDVAESTVRMRLSTVRAFFRWCIEQKLLRHDPTATIKTPKQPRRTPRFLTPEQVTRLDHVLPDARAQLIVALMLDMGLRAGEVAKLEMADLDFYGGLARINGKGGHERLLPLTDLVTYRIGLHLIERGRGSGHLIRSYTSRDGLSVGTVSRLMTGWMREAGIKQDAYDGKSAHALRHSMAENMRRHGAELEVIRDALGHKDLSTTVVYLRGMSSIEDLREAMGHDYVDVPKKRRLKPVAVVKPAADGTRIPQGQSKVRVARARPQRSTIPPSFT